MHGSERRERHVGRTLASAILVVLGVACIAVGSITAWLRTQVLDTQQWVDTSRQVIVDPAVQGAVAVWTVDQLFDRAQPEDVLDDVLPARARFLAGPLVSRLRVESYEVAAKALAEPAVQDVWVTVNRRAHERLVRAVHGDAPIVVEGPGGVRLDLRPLLERVAARVGIDEVLVDRIPEAVTTVQPKDGEQIERGLRALRALDRWGPLVTFLALPFLGLGIWLARDRRRTWIWIGAAVVVASFAVARACASFGPVLSGVMTETTTWRAAIEATWDAMSRLLRDSTRAGVVVGLLVMLVAWSTGPARYLVRARRASAPLLVDRSVAFVAGTAVAAWFLVEALPVFEVTRPGVKAVLVLSAAGAAWMLSRIARRERDDAARDDDHAPEETATA